MRVTVQFNRVRIGRARTPLPGRTGNTTRSCFRGDQQDGRWPPGGGEVTRLLALRSDRYGRTRDERGSDLSIRHVLAKLSASVARRRPEHTVGEPEQLAAMLDRGRLLCAGLLAGGRLHLSDDERQAGGQFVREGMANGIGSKDLADGGTAVLRNAWNCAPPSSASTGAPVWSTTRLRIAIRPVSRGVQRRRTGGSKTPAARKRSSWCGGTK